MDRASPYRFRIVHDSDDASFDAVCVTLYRCSKGICGWFMSPAGSRLFDDGYVPSSARLIASSAVLRAIAVAEHIGAEVCIIDPERLWKEVWGGPSDLDLR